MSEVLVDEPVDLKTEVASGMEGGSIVKASLAFIEANLEKPIRLRDVARQASLSTFHFHRIFREELGIPVGEYIRRRRLEAAALRLMRTRDRILDIAIDSHFESQEAFARAFKRQFGATPTTFRARGGNKLTELQSRKMAHFFAVWDSDGDGVVDKRDFDHLVARMADALDIDRTSEDFADLQRRYDGFWLALAAAITEPGRTGLYLPEWLAACGELLPTAAFKAQVGGVVDFLWYLLDRDGDGLVSRDDYAKVVAAYLQPRRVVDDLFDRLGKSPKDSLRKGEVAQLVHEFYWSEDPGAAGGFMWGPF